MTEDEGRALWMVASPVRTTVPLDGAAVWGDGERVREAVPAPGAHVASASFMVGSAAPGRGVGRTLVEDPLPSAGAAGFRTSTRAVETSGVSKDVACRGRAIDGLRLPFQNACK